jgi:hypothetical protein
VTTEPLPPSPPADRAGPAAATVLAGALLILVGIAWLLDAGGSRCPGGRSFPGP